MDKNVKVAPLRLVPFTNRKTVTNTKGGITNVGL